jgi:site-specific DNA recombinase
VFGRNRCGKYHHTGDGGEVTRGNGKNRAGNPIITADVHDQLIDPVMFSRVQNKLAERRASGRKPRYSRYVLSGVLRCGHCGAPLAGKGYSKGNVPRYYVCTNGTARPGTCKRYQMPQVAIEEYVLGVLSDRLFADDAVERIRKAIYQRAKGRQRTKSETKMTQARIDALDRKIAKGTENLLLADADSMADMSALLAEWRAEREKLQGELESAAANPDGVTPDRLAERALAELNRLREHFNSGDPAYVRAVAQSMVSEVRLWWEPFGKRTKRFTHGEMKFRGGLEFMSPGKKTG